MGTANWSDEFKRDAVAVIIERRYSAGAPTPRTSPFYSLKG